ncbi:thiol reductase thioredoxin [Virgisporangium aliadipatigenens]|uniref:Thiol reductase thioredoxin n=1 Tax=Virgisporangium aliadipatigenens TaxID=741659 RepID=A0A8J3YU29_9ACTN|nr:thiol reductase thioredoxin [Virgisporangium aliadipatigenens]
MAVAVLAVATIFGLVWRSRQGRLVRVAEAAASGPVTLLQFSAPACGPCRQVRALCESLAGPDVRHVEVDAAADPDRSREFDVLRTPTLLVLDAAGTPVWRTVGVPRRADLEAALAGVR